MDAEGIIYFFQGEFVSAYIYNAIPLRLMVRKDQVQDAMDVLRDLDLSLTFGGLFAERRLVLLKANLVKNLVLLISFKKH